MATAQADRKTKSAQIEQFGSHSIYQRMEYGPRHKQSKSVSENPRPKNAGGAVILSEISGIFPKKR